MVVSNEILSSLANCNKSHEVWKSYRKNETKRFVLVQLTCKVGLVVGMAREKNGWHAEKTEERHRSCRFLMPPKSFESIHTGLVAQTCPTRILREQ